MIVTVQDDDGTTHTLSPSAGLVLHLALLVLDSRLRPPGLYTKGADKLYTALAKPHEKGLDELRRVFRLGAQRPWLVE